MKTLNVNATQTTRDVSEFVFRNLLGNNKGMVRQGYLNFFFFKSKFYIFIPFSYFSFHFDYFLNDFGGFLKFWGNQLRNPN